LNLCAGLDERNEDWDPAQRVRRPLLELLAIPRKAWRQPGPVERPLWAASALLQPEAIEKASRNGMKPLSAFDDKAWAWIRQGWELNEHQVRQLTKKEREEELAEVQEMHADDPARARAAVEQLVQGWSDNAKQRPRPWLDRPMERGA
jgi:DNA polymerase III subunit gamma/tau